MAHGHKATTIGISLCIIMATTSSKKDYVDLYVLWIGEVIKDLLVENVKYYIQEIPAKLDHKVAIKTTTESKDFMMLQAVRLAVQVSEHTTRRRRNL
jgi:hypothetical protein